MKSVTKLKDDARKHEQKEEWDKAIAAYLQVLKTGEEGEGELDLPLYNRVGDLYLRMSRPQDAVGYYVQAADRYAEAGLYNNAIALCNKALRYVPQQIDLLHKLGQFSASQGFLTDARRYFLEYAEKKFAGGLVDDALTALEEFADLSGDAEIREMLARQLHANNRTEEAVEALRTAWTLRTRNGDQQGADRVRDEIEALAPGTMTGDEGSAYEEPLPMLASEPEEAAADEEEEESFSFHIDATAATEQPAADESLAGLESTHFDVASPEDAGDFRIQGFETTHAEPELDPDQAFQLPDFESTTHEGAVSADDLGLEPTTFEAPAEIDAAPLTDLAFDESSFGDAGAEEDSAFDLPLLGGDDEAATLSDDGETQSLDLPDFEIEPLTEDSDEMETGSFELPMLDSESGDADAPPFGGLDLPLLTTDGADDDAADDSAALEIELPAPDDDFEDFGEHGRRAAPGEIAAAPGTTAEASTPGVEDEFIQDLMAESAEAEAAGATPSTGIGWDPSSLGPPPPPTPAAPPSKPRPTKAKDGSDFIDLGAFLTADDEEEDNTRFRVQEKAPTGDEDHDFAELLSQFKQKVSENVSAEDSAAHYDLGLAFKEMGLIDEAIGEFQIAMRAGDMRLRVYEELGQCFLLKGQFNIAEKVLTRALAMQRGTDELGLIGVYYHLGNAYEGLGNREAARDAYERVLGLDINFRDVSARLNRL